MDYKTDNIGPELACDLTGEMGNQILGRVKRSLSGLGIPISIGLPNVALGAEHEVIHKCNTPVMLVSAQAGESSCHLEFGYEEASELDMENPEKVDDPITDIVFFEE